jgi:hypothetical protein
MAKVFLSYASSDAILVENFARLLRDNSVDVWVDRADIAGGQVWRRRIVEAISEATVVVLVLSRASVLSRNVRKELDIAEEANRPILPVQVEPVDIPADLSYQLAGLQRVMVPSDLNDCIEPVLRALSGLADNKSGIAESASTDIDSPPAVSNATAPLARETGDSAVPHRVFENAWYRPDARLYAKWFFLAYEWAGQVNIYRDRIRLVASSAELNISFAEVNSVTLERMSGDPLTRWCVVRFGRPERVAGFKAFTRLVWNNETSALQSAIETALASFRQSQHV